jgi:hypothetical protein
MGEVEKDWGEKPDNDGPINLVKLWDSYEAKVWALHPKDFQPRGEPSTVIKPFCQSAGLWLVARRELGEGAEWIVEMDGFLTDTQVNELAREYLFLEIEDDLKTKVMKGI